MFDSANKANQILEESLIIDPSFSYINLVQEEPIREHKKNGHRTRSKMAQFSKSRERLQLRKIRS